MSDLRIDFYVLEDSSGRERLKLACRLAEKAYLASQGVLLWLADPQEIRVLDELLWTFRDGSFVPHEVLDQSASTGDAPVLLSTEPSLPPGIGLTINLAVDTPPFAHQCERLIEIIDGDGSRRQAGRARFKAYRDRGLHPVTHPVRTQ